MVCFGMLALALGFGWSPKLGLDLEGGLSAVFKPNKTVSTATLQDVVNIMTLRVNASVSPRRTSPRKETTSLSSCPA